MSLTTTDSRTATSSSSPAIAAKDWDDFLGQILPGAVQAVAPSLGIDPRVAGQAVGQILGLFGIGGAKGFAPAIPQAQAKAQLQQILTPYFGDETFRAALQKWLQAAVEPVQAQKQGKAYTPTVDLSKDWFTSALSSIGNAVSSVDWGKVAQVGMQALPYVIAALA